MTSNSGVRKAAQLVVDTDADRSEVFASGSFSDVRHALGDLRRAIDVLRIALERDG